MAGAATILFAREDLSIPGSVDAVADDERNSTYIRDKFFQLLHNSSPDVVVLDLSSAVGGGVEAILDIRRSSRVPVLVVCDPAQPEAANYRSAGAWACIAAPVDLMTLNQSIQEIIRVTREVRPATPHPASSFRFSGLCFQPDRNVLVDSSETATVLTTAEARLLSHFLTKPWALCPRTEIGELLYGGNSAVGDRAMDVVINRLRKKLVAAGGPDAEYLIKTEFRQGYVLVSDVTVEPHAAAGARNGRAG